eukprot:COSAG02_NODE_32837_length_509_cov_2.014634_1_plen_97_part_01
MPGVTLRRPGIPVGPGAWDWAYLWVPRRFHRDRTMQSRLQNSACAQCRVLTGPRRESDSSIELATLARARAGGSRPPLKVSQCSGQEAGGQLAAPCV